MTSLRSAAGCAETRGAASGPAAGGGHEGLTTNWVVEGSGPAVVLVHGVGLDLAMWGPQAAALRARRRVLRYDLIGHGATPGLSQPLSLDDFAAQLEDLLDALELERAALVGFSMGALVAQAFALAHPARVERLALLACVHARSRSQSAGVRARLAAVERGGTAATSDAALERWLTPAYRRRHAAAAAAVRQRLEANDRDAFLAAYRLFAHADAELAPRLGAITAPTLVVAGEHDSGSTPAMARRLAATIPGARLHVLPGVRHLFTLEAAADVNSLLLDFLEQRR